MADKIEFTRNYSDLSTSEGFQFEFYCDRCGTGYRTPFKASLTGKVANVLDAAGSFFGGVLGLSLIHICRCPRRGKRRTRWAPHH